MRIEPLTQAGAPQVVALLDVLGYPTSVQQCRLRIERLLAQPDSAGWCAVDGDIIGIAAGRLQWMLQADEPVAELIALAVAPSHSGRGVGRQLLTTFEQWATTAGTTRLKVMSGSHRDGAHAFYQRCGYTLTGVRFHKVWTRLPETSDLDREPPTIQDT